MKRIPIFVTAMAAVAVLGAPTAPVAAASTASPTTVSKQCSRGMLHKNGHRDCGKHKGSMNKGTAPTTTPKSGTAPTPGNPSGHPAPGAGPNGS